MAIRDYRKTLYGLGAAALLGIGAVGGGLYVNRGLKPAYNEAVAQLGAAKTAAAKVPKLEETVTRLTTEKDVSDKEKGEWLEMIEGYKGLLKTYLGEAPESPAEPATK